MAVGPGMEPWPTAAERTANRLPARPRLVDDEPSILGLTRRSHGHVGSRAFTLFFLAVFAIIFVQLVVALLNG